MFSIQEAGPAKHLGIMLCLAGNKFILQITMGNIGYSSENRIPNDPSLDSVEISYLNKCLHLTLTHIHKHSAFKIDD